MSEVVQPMRPKSFPFAEVFDKPSNEPSWAQVSPSLFTRALILWVTPFIVLSFWLGSFLLYFTIAYSLTERKSYETLN